MLVLHDVGNPDSVLAIHNFPELSQEQLLNTVGCGSTTQVLKRNKIIYQNNVVKPGSEETVHTIGKVFAFSWLTRVQSQASYVIL